MELEKKLKTKNRIIVILASILGIVVLAILSFVVYLGINIMDTRDDSDRELEGETYLYTCYPFFEQDYCESIIGTYHINGKEYKISVGRFQAYGVFGNILAINGKGTEVGWMSELQSIELFNDEFFLVKSDNGVTILDLEGETIKEIRLWGYYNNTQTIKKDGVYYLEYSVCEEDTYKHMLLNLQNLEETEELIRLTNVSCIDIVREGTKMFE